MRPVAVDLSAEAFTALLELSEILIEDFYRPNLDAYGQHQVGLNVPISSACPINVLSQAVVKSKL